jgi:hypothetical protein
MAPKTNSLQDRQPETPVARIEARRGPPISSELGSKSTAAPYADRQWLSTDGKSEQRCDWCNKPFSPRQGTGGSPQRFCSNDCRKTSNREQQRLQRRGSYAGPSTPPAISPTPNETLRREPTVAALHPWETGVLDIANLQRTEFVVALNDGETAGTGIETWLAEILAFMSQRVTRWVEEHKDTRIVRAMTIAAPKHNGVRSCVLILHHSPKRDAVPASDSEALHPAPAGRRAVS